MAVALDSSASAGSATVAVQTLTSSTLTTVAANCILIASVHAFNNNIATGTSCTDSTGLTWVQVKADSAAFGAHIIYRAFAPTAGTALTVTITWAGTAVKSELLVSAYSGIDTSGTSGSGALGTVPASSTASSLDAQTTITTTRDLSLVIGILTIASTPVSYTQPAGQSSTVGIATSGASSSRANASRQNATTTPSGTVVTMGGPATLNVSVRWLYQALEIMAPVAGSPTHGVALIGRVR